MGAGDLIASSVAGIKFGPVLLWTVIVGTGIKFVLNEGIARWQLATDTTLLEGWALRMGKGVLVCFGIYLVLWSFVVAGALISACGLAAKTLTGTLSTPIWGLVHSLTAAGLVLWGRYRGFERLMKVLIFPMFVLVIFSAILVQPDWLMIGRQILHPSMPPGSGALVLGVIGGVGGSVTLLSYGYWIREKQWSGAEFQRQVRWDLGFAYVLTGLFGMGMIIFASGIPVNAMEGTALLIGLGDRLGDLAGPWARWSFFIGFWCAVFTSMIGVWQGVPYIWADFVRLVRPVKGRVDSKAVLTDSPQYRGFLAYLALPPMVLVLINKPIWVVIAYTVTGALFMPLLAATLLAMNTRRIWLGDLRNGWIVNGLIILSLILFSGLAMQEISGLLTG